MKRMAIAIPLALLAAAAAHAADHYPSRPVTLVVAYAAGGMTDILTRKLATDLRECHR